MGVHRATPGGGAPHPSPSPQGRGRGIAYDRSVGAERKRSPTIHGVPGNVGLRRTAQRRPTSKCDTPGGWKGCRRPRNTNLFCWKDAVGNLRKDAILLCYPSWLPKRDIRSATAISVSQSCSIRSSRKHSLPTRAMTPTRRSRRWRGEALRPSSLPKPSAASRAEPAAHRTESAISSSGTFAISSNTALLQPATTSSPTLSLRLVCGQSWLD